MKAKQRTDGRTGGPARAAHIDRRSDSVASDAILINAGAAGRGERRRGARGEMGGGGEAPTSQDMRIRAVGGRAPVSGYAGGGSGSGGDRRNGRLAPR